MARDLMVNEHLAQQREPYGDTEWRETAQRRAVVRRL